MSQSLREDLQQSNEFSQVNNHFQVESAEFEATVDITEGKILLTVTLPTLNAVVVEEDVAEVIHEGWFDTLSRRLRDMTDITSADITDPQIVLQDDTVLIKTEITPRQDEFIDDIISLINFVEGTWIGGIIPGYTYSEKVQSIRQQAAQQGGSDDPTPL
ncbi:MAG: DUF5813 family protein [Halobacteriaceae archaeon]